MGCELKKSKSLAREIYKIEIAACKLKAYSLVTKKKARLIRFWRIYSTYYSLFEVMCQFLKLLSLNKTKCRGWLLLL